MTVEEALKRTQWTHHMKRDLVILYNQHLRPGERPITINALSSPCRLRNMLGALKCRVEEINDPGKKKVLEIWPVNL